MPFNFLTSLTSVLFGSYLLYALLLRPPMSALLTKGAEKN